MAKFGEQTSCFVDSHTVLCEARLSSIYFHYSLEMLVTIKLTLGKIAYLMRLNDQKTAHKC